MSDTTAPGLPLAHAAQLFHLLADPARLRMLYLLLDHGELHVGAVCEALGLSQTGVSHNLSLLRQVGVVEGRREKQRTFYRIDSDLVVALLQHCGGEWVAVHEGK